MDVTKLSTDARQHQSLRVRVTGNQQRSGELTVKQISVVPWEVVRDQVGKRYSVMDLGQDSPVLCLQFGKIELDPSCQKSTHVFACIFTCYACDEESA